MITFSSISKRGNREINEDSFACASISEKYLLVVADGLGGHGYGEIASRLAAETMEKVFLNEEDMPLDILLDVAINQAQRVILNEQEKKHAQLGMKTTIVALCCNKKDICW